MRATVPPSVEVWSHEVIGLLDETRQARERIVRERTMEAARNYFDTETRVLRELFELAENAPGFNVAAAISGVLIPQLNFIAEVWEELNKKLKEENHAT